MNRARTAGALALCSLAALLTAMFIRTHAMPAPPEYFAYDQQAYLSLAHQPFVQTPAVYPPASWRVLPPLVARVIGDLIGGGPERGFLVLTFACLVLMPIAAFAWLAALGIDGEVALWCAAIVALSPTVLGYTAWDAVRVDPISLLLLFAACRAIVACERLSFVTSVAALALTKETFLIAAVFAIAWGVRVDRRILVTAIATLVLGVIVRSIVLPAIMPPTAPFDNLFSFKRMIRDELTVSYAARRLLLATGAAWNLMLPMAAAWIVDDARNPRTQMLALGIAIAEAQILFASDTQRVVAAAYPFMIACTGLALSRIRSPRGGWAGAALVAAQLPWLLENGRIVHLPWLRGVEIVIVLVSAGLVAAGLRRQWSAMPFASV